MGGGFEICLGCDMIVASPQATFGLPEAMRGMASQSEKDHYFFPMTDVRQVFTQALEAFRASFV